MAKTAAIPKFDVDTYGATIDVATYIAAANAALVAANTVINQVGQDVLVINTLNAAVNTAMTQLTGNTATIAALQTLITSTNTSLGTQTALFGGLQTSNTNNTTAIANIQGETISTAAAANSPNNTVAAGDGAATPFTFTDFESFTAGPTNTNIVFAWTVGATTTTPAYLTKIGNYNNLQWDQASIVTTTGAGSLTIQQSGPTFPSPTNVVNSASDTTVYPIVNANDSAGAASWISIPLTLTNISSGQTFSFNGRLGWLANGNVYTAGVIIANVFNTTIVATATWHLEAGSVNWLSAT